MTYIIEVGFCYVFHTPNISVFIYSVQYDELRFYKGLIPLFDEPHVPDYGHIVRIGILSVVLNCIILLNRSMPFELGIMQ